MDFLPKHVVEKLANKYKLSSINIMGGRIKRIHKILKLKKYDIDVLLNLELIKKTIKKHIKNTACAKDIINTIIQVLKIEEKNDNLKPYEKYFKSLVNTHKEAYLLKEPSKKELENVVSMNDVITLFKQYETQINAKKDKHDQYLWVRYVLLAMYSLFPPLRGEEWYKTKVESIQEEDVERRIELYNEILNRDQENFYNIHNGELVLKFYKTMSTYGLRILKLPDELQDIIKQWKTINTSHYLIPNIKTGTPLSQQGFTEKFNNIFFPKKVSSSMIRKVYVSEIVPNISNDARKQLKHTMGHSLAVQTMVYSRFQKGGGEKLGKEHFEKYNVAFPIDNEDES